MSRRQGIICCCVVLVLCAMLCVVGLLLPCHNPEDFPVGGKTGEWKIPSSPSESFNVWAKNNTFRIGDSLVFNYDKDDSVLEVIPRHYNGCITSDPIREYREGKNHIELERGGWYYFISGAEGHCKKGEKLELMVSDALRATYNHKISLSLCCLVGVVICFF